MIEYLTKQDLEEAGVVVPDGKVSEFLQHANESLAERIEAEVANSLSEEEAEEMLEVQETGDDDALQAWIAVHVPELIEIVQDEIDILLDELAA
ncbi:MAG: DUF5663 domain-containing protein [Candidatus Saccharimonadaceae bacterium]